MDETERTVYEKVLAAYYAAEEQPRLRQDDFLYDLLTPEERASDAYRTFEYLRGRSPEFAAFLCRELGFSDAAAAAGALTTKYADGLRTRADRFQSTGR